jgi:hypothetical protein
VLELPPEVFVPDQNFLYEFSVTYFLTNNRGRVVTTTSGFNVRLDLFDHSVNPYYSYYHSYQEVPSGNSVYTPDNLTTNTAGIDFRKGPFTALVEYQDTASNIHPSKRLRGEAGVTTNLSETATIMAKGFYTRTTYPDNAANAGNRVTDTVRGAMATTQKYFPRKNIHLSASGNYTQVSGSTESRYYTLTGALLWKIAKLDLSAGVTITHGVTDTTAGEQTVTNQYYYLRMLRRLF